MKALARMLVISGINMVSMGSALAQDRACAGIEDSAARLACYDRQAGRPAQPVAPVPAAAAAAAPAVPRSDPPPPAESAREALRRRTDFDSSLAAVTPLRHGYYRLVLADGTAYDTTAVVVPPAVGDAIHVRRTPFGTTFFDLADRRSITVRLSRRQ